MSYPFHERRVVVGVCGSIAAYKACELVSRLRQEEAAVRVVMTRNATAFVGPATLRALSGSDVACEMFGAQPETEIEHISLAEFGEVTVIVAATANVIGKVAAGICDDLLTTTISAAAGPVVVAPAMNWRMWENPITQRNVALLTELGYLFVGPDCGHLACGDTGSGRLSHTADILDAIDQSLGPTDSKLRGKRVLVTAGPTREWLDPVRFISNPSSGKMGFALAAEALARGAHVTVVTGPTAERPPWRAPVVAVETTAQMLDAVQDRYAETDIVVGAAAPADFGPAARAPQKLKKDQAPPVLELALTPDILATLAPHKGPRLHIGFAAETGNLAVHARQKLAAKQLDLIVANDITAPGAGFGSATNEVTIYGREGAPRPISQRTKREVARAVWDEIERLVG